MLGDDPPRLPAAARANAPDQIQIAAMVAHCAASICARKIPGPVAGLIQFDQPGPYARARCDAQQGTALRPHLIRMWLDCPVEETDDRGRKTRTTDARDKRRGMPQGSPLSPLLANIYMRRFVLGWKMFGLERTLGTRLVTYADDLVILCRRGKAEAALQRLREIMGKLSAAV